MMLSLQEEGTGCNDLSGCPCSIRELLEPTKENEGKIQLLSK